MILQLEKRINILLSISIRAIDLEYTKYKIRIKCEEQEVESKETERTNVNKEKSNYINKLKKFNFHLKNFDNNKMPIFYIDKTNDALYKFIMNTTKCKIKNIIKLII
jgi:hypothetical protein